MPFDYLFTRLSWPQNFYGEKCSIINIYNTNIFSLKDLTFELLIMIYKKRPFISRVKQE
jgi:hypothetical protein